MTFCFALVVFFLSSCCFAISHQSIWAQKQGGRRNKEVFLGCNCIPSVGAQEQKSNTVNVSSVSHRDAAIMMPIPILRISPDTTRVEYSARTENTVCATTSCSCMYSCMCFTLN